MSNGRSYGVIDLVQKYIKHVVTAKQVKKWEQEANLCNTEIIANSAAGSGIGSNVENNQKNIVIIGNGIGIKNPHQIYSWQEIMDNISIFNLDIKIRVLVLKWVYREYNVGEDGCNEPFKPLLALIEKYLEDNKAHYIDGHIEKLNKDEFKNAVNMLHAGDSLRRLFEDKDDTFTLGHGVSVVHLGHVCGNLMALLVPYFIDKLRHLNNPTLIVDGIFLKNCSCADFGHDYYKISNEFHSRIRKMCWYNKPQLIEYIEYTSERLPKILVEYIDTNAYLNSKAKIDESRNESA